jgi:hypothetical protein
LILLAVAGPAYAFQLITAEDASGKSGPVLESRGPIPGPVITVNWPEDHSKLASSPVAFDVTFKTFAATKVDLATVRIIYVKDPWVDLTKRVTDRLGPTGFEPTGFKFDDAEVVSGTHTIRIEARDTEGRKGFTNITFTVGR